MRYEEDGVIDMSSKKTLSAIIIAKNEAVRIGACVDALRFCDEIIVIDNNSKDDTVSVARQHDAVVVEFHAENFAEVRTVALKYAHGDWILYVDADETIDPVLTESILRTVEQNDTKKATSYRLSRTNYYLGTRWPQTERMERLFFRPALKQWKGELHETPVTTGNTADLPGEIIHDTHRTLEEMVAKTNEWSETEAELRLRAHHPTISWWRLIRVLITGFWQSFVTNGGWRAGTVGWIESIYQGFSLFITYAKLWEMQHTNPVKKQ